MLGVWVGLTLLLALLLCRKRWRSAAGLWVGLVSLAAAVGYGIGGAGEDLRLAQAQTAASTSEQAMQHYLALFTQRMQHHPQHSEGWFLLAETLLAAQRYTDAAEAYRQAYRYYQQQQAADTAGLSQLASRLGQAVYLANDAQITPEALSYWQQALRHDPSNAQVLGLLGLALYEAGDYRHAIEYWQQLLQQLPPSSDRTQIQAGIARAQAQLSAASTNKAESAQ